MKNVLALIAIAGVAGAASAQDLIAYWNFNDSTPGVSGSLGVLNGFNGTGFPSDAGAGLLTTNIAINTSISPNDGTLGTFAGTTQNALFGDGSGGALSIQAGQDQVNNGNWIQFEFDASDYTDINITWSGRGTGTGFGDPFGIQNTVQFSTDGVNFTSVGTYASRQTSFQLYDFSMGSGLDFADNAIIRIVFDGATGAQGNNRLDNVQITGTFIPAPGAFALLGLGGLAAARRRR